MSTATPTTTRKKRRPSDGTMALVEHFQEFRRRLIISVLAVVMGAVVGFIWYQNSIPGIPTLGELLREPYCNLPPENRAFSVDDGECRLLAIKPLEMLLLRMKVGALAGLIFASPVWLYQIWAFITPGLHKNERKYTFTFVGLSVFMFVLGAFFAYLVLSYGLEILLTMGDEAQVAGLTGGEYFNFVLSMLAIFGVSFELPLILIMMNFAGLLPYEAIKGRRDVIWIALAVFSAIMTPTQDPFTMLGLMVALIVLVEGALMVMRLRDKKREKQRPEWMDLGDNEASPMIPSTGGIEPPQPVNGSSGIAHPTRIHASGPIRQSHSGTPNAAVKPQHNIQSPKQPKNFFDDVT